MRQAVLHLGDTRQKLAHFVLRADFDRPAQVAGGDVAEVLQGGLERPRNRAAQGKPAVDGERQPGKQRGNGNRPDSAEGRFGGFIAGFGQR
ncbi:hypothetical protein ACU4GD_16555 [Cupriavidus basilensis]